MSGPDKERSSGGDDGGGAGGPGGGGDEDEDGVISPSKKDGLKGKAAEKSEMDSKRASVFRFGKAKKTLQLVQGRVRRRRRRKKKGSLVNSGCFGSCGDAVVGCCLCEKQPQAMDSSGKRNKKTMRNGADEGMVPMSILWYTSISDDRGSRGPLLTWR